jgi:hypothetical protein
MDDTTFWGLVDQARDNAEGDPDRQGDALEALLTGRPQTELEAFERIFAGLRRRAYRWDVWAAGYVIARGMSDDSFSEFRDWLISRGADVYERALADPDSLADVPDARPETVYAPRVGAAAGGAYWDTYGVELERVASDGPKPAGEEWEDPDLADIVPRLFAKWDRSMP